MVMSSSLSVIHFSRRIRLPFQNSVDIHLRSALQLCSLKFEGNPSAPNCSYHPKWYQHNQTVAVLETYKEYNVYPSTRNL